MKMVRKIASGLLICWMVLPCSGQTGNSWDKVRYNGGTVSTRTSPDDWGNRLTVNSESIKLFLKDGQTISINPSNVTGLSYGQSAHGRVGTMVARGILVAPVALFGLFHKTKLHYIGVEYNSDEGKKAGMLLQGHKDNYRAILQALKSVSGKEVQTTSNERLNLAHRPQRVVANLQHYPSITQA